MISTNYNKSNSFAKTGNNKGKVSNQCNKAKKTKQTYKHGEKTTRKAKTMRNI